MNSWKIILATVVIFGTGVLTGGLLVHYVEQPHPTDVQRPPDEAISHPQVNIRDDDQPRPQDLPKARSPEILGRQFVQQLDNTLHLTREQRAAVAKIVADGQERNREIWANVAPQMHKLLQDVRQQIREQLTPEQRKQFEELLKRFRPPGHRQQPSPNSPPPPNEPPPLAPTNPPPDV